jgi:hypothetical protein
MMSRSKPPKVCILVRFIHTSAFTCAPYRARVIILCINLDGSGRAPKFSQRLLGSPKARTPGFLRLGLQPSILPRAVLRSAPSYASAELASVPRISTFRPAGEATACDRKMSPSSPESLHAGMRRSNAARCAGDFRRPSSRASPKRCDSIRTNAMHCFGSLCRRLPRRSSTSYISTNIVCKCRARRSPKQHSGAPSGEGSALSPSIVYGVSRSRRVFPGKRSIGFARHGRDCRGAR